MNNSPRLSCKIAHNVLADVVNVNQERHSVNAILGRVQSILRELSKPLDMDTTTHDVIVPVIALESFHYMYANKPVVRVSSANGRYDALNISRATTYEVDIYIVAFTMQIKEKTNACIRGPTY